MSLTHEMGFVRAGRRPGLLACLACALVRSREQPGRSHVLLALLHQVARPLGLAAGTVGQGLLVEVPCATHAFGLGEDGRLHGVSGLGGPQVKLASANATTAPTCVPWLSV